MHLSGSGHQPALDGPGSQKTGLGRGYPVKAEQAPEPIPEPAADPVPRDPEAGR